MGGFAGVAITDLVGVIWDYVNPNSDHNRLNRVEEKVETFRLKHAHELDAFKNVTMRATTLFNATIQQVMDTKQQLHQLMTDLPEYVFGAAYIIERVQRAAALVRAITVDCHSFVRLDALAELLQYPELLTLHEKDTIWMGITADENVKSIRFKFKAVSPAKDTFITKVQAFDHWVFYKDKPAEYVKYDGADTLIYNTTSMCARSITLPDSHVIMASCRMPNSTSEDLKRFKVLKTSRNVTAERQITQVKEFGALLMVNCYPEPITVAKKTVQCPHHPFSLSVLTAFETTDFVYKPEQSPKAKKPILESRLSSHFAHSKVDDELDLMAHYQELRAVEMMNGGPGPLEEIPKVFQWTTVVLFGGLVALVAALFEFIYRRDLRAEVAGIATEMQATGARMTQAPRDALSATSRLSQDSGLTGPGSTADSSVGLIS